MRTSKVAKRYAQGLLNFTQEAGTTRSVFFEMRDMVNTIEKSKELQSFFHSPIIEVKKKISDSILKSTSLVNHNNQFDVKSIINPEILGGYILRVGDQQIDESVKTKLSRLNKEFQLN